MAEQPETRTPTASRSAPTKPLGHVDDDAAAYATARNEIKNKERAEARKATEDPFKDGQEAAEQRAEVAAETSEPVVDEGITLAENDIFSGGKGDTVNQPDPGALKDSTHAARLMLRAAKAMAKHSGLATLLPPADTWGLVGQGDEVNGHFVLIDLDTLEKRVVTERWVINEDKIYANAQQWPKALMKGDILQRAAKG